ncbi:MAG: NIF family HAD-type phosphatase, partial [Bradymonadia bacterium]
MTHARPIIAVTIIALIAGVGCTSLPETKPTPAKVDAPAQADIVSSKSVPSLPEWTDRYADGKKGDVRFFNMSRLMSEYELSRVQAVELQNQYRDLTRQDASFTGEKGFNAALKAVRAYQYESRLDVEGLKKAKFIVVFDLDETLFDQYYSGGESCHTHAFKKADGKMKYIHMVPGWERVIKSIHELGGRVVIFSANLDDRTLEILRNIKIDDVPMLESPFISGAMTNSFLIQQEKTEPPGSPEKPRKGRPVIEPSKDLRFFDESLSKVIIVDDNPLRLFQFRNVRVFKKFHADDFCGAKSDVFKQAVEWGMLAV